MASGVASGVASAVAGEMETKAYGKRACRMERDSGEKSGGLRREE